MASNPIGKCCTVGVKFTYVRSTPRPAPRARSPSKKPPRQKSIPSPAPNPANPCSPRACSGESTGKAVKIAGKWDGYLATPAPEKARAGAGILYLPDVIGIWQNSKLMADQFAANGYLTLVVDLFNGDPLPVGDKPPGFDFMEWHNKGTGGNNPHTPDAVDPIVEAAAKAMKEEYGVTKLAAVGYCFGAKVRRPPFCFLSLSLSAPCPSNPPASYPFPKT